ncbi:hypothetical protein [Moorena producens]|uniref:hypothetical protein n=1 Tax=Moorena producens TaxID=1155739 RepID=UPI0011EA690E|nr:hypothetical protein [Moorena producens]
MGRVPDGYYQLIIGFISTAHRQGNGIGNKLIVGWAVDKTDNYQLEIDLIHCPPTRKWHRE